jgi:hypothetical protein
MSYVSLYRLLLCAVLAILSSCGQMPSSEPGANPESAEPVLCINKTQCDVYWQRAQAWVANNSRYRLQTITDTVIETYGPLATQTGLAFRITKVPDDKDGARIYVLPVCSNVFACSPTPADAVIAFKQFVRN